MAFLFEADRGLTQINDPYSHLGPGAYIQQQGIHNKSPGYAPFSSTGEKIISLVPKQKVTQPGPGSYDIGKPLGDSGVQAYMNKQTIIVKVQGNGSSAFRSNQDRFKNRAQSNPGPGYYSTQFEGNKSVKNVQRKGRMIEDLRKLNQQRKIQSIPQQLVTDGKVFQDIETYANEKIKFQSQQNNRVGPGAYELPTSIGVGSTVQWGKQKTQRFSDSQGIGSGLGPGKYNINKKMVQKFKNNASPCFISETVRTHFDQMLYNTNSELKAELRKQTGYKDSNIPGPGQYETKIEAIKIGRKAREFQFFGSSLERFENNKASNLGPGYYQLNNSLDALNKKKNYVNHSFMSSQPKDDQYILELDDKPGPGAYNSNIYTIKQQTIKKFTQGYKGSFGCTEKRFEGEKQFEDIGPGRYEISNLNPVQQKRALSVFKSSTQRGKSFDVGHSIKIKYNFIFKGNVVPSIGSYDLGQFNIGTKINKQSNFLKNLRKIDVVKPGFDSGQPRFSEPVKINSQTSQLDIQSVVNDNSFSTYQTYNPKQIKAPFASKSKRMEYLQNSNTPGVGLYQIEQNNWNKNSFNTHYNKLLEE